MSGGKRLGLSARCGGRAEVLSVLGSERDRVDQLGGRGGHAGEQGVRGRVLPIGRHQQQIEPDRPRASPLQDIHEQRVLVPGRGPATVGPHGRIVHLDDGDAVRGRAHPAQRDAPVEQFQIGEGKRPGDVQRGHEGPASPGRDQAVDDPEPTRPHRPHAGPSASSRGRRARPCRRMPADPQDENAAAPCPHRALAPEVPLPGGASPPALSSALSPAARGPRPG